MTAKMNTEAFDVITEYISYNGMNSEDWREDMCEMLFNTCPKFHTEQECYDYIHNDLQSFVDLMKYVDEQNERFETKFDTDVVKMFNLAWYYIGADKAMEFSPDEPESESEEEENFEEMMEEVVALHLNPSQ